MTLQQLSYFCAVVEAGTISQASRQLHISQPSLSIALTHLESELGVSLFQRSNRRLLLTAEGRTFYEEARHILQHIETVKKRMDDLANRNHTIRLGVAPMMSNFLFPIIFTAFHKAHPEVEFELHESGVENLAGMLANHELDLAFLIQKEDLPVQLMFQPLIHTQYKLYVGAGHRLSKAKTVKIADLAEEPLVFYRDSSYVQSVVTDIFQQYHIKPKILHRTNQIHTIKQFVADNTAAAFLTEKAVDRQEPLHPVLPDPPIPVTIGISWNRDGYLNKTSLKLIEFLKSHI